MRTLFLASATLIVAATAAMASTDRDRFGEALFFGRNYGHMHVIGPEGNLVQDKYGDVKVIFCAPGEWMISIDPNRCGFATSRGEPCTEMPTILSGPWSNTFARGNHYLTHRNTGERQEIKSIGESQYELVPLPGQKPVKIWQAEKPINGDELAEYCDR
jgi:hypothetical protein